MMNFSLAMLCSFLGLLVPGALRFAQQQSCSAGRLSRCSATRRAAIIFTWSSINRRAPDASRISMREASSLWASRMRRATLAVSVGFRAGHDTCCSEISYDQDAVVRRLGDGEMEFAR